MIKLLQRPKRLPRTCKHGTGQQGGWGDVLNFSEVMSLHAFMPRTGIWTLYKWKHWQPVDILVSILISQVFYLPALWGRLKRKTGFEHTPFCRSEPSLHIWSLIANRHKYSATALACAGDNMANCSLQWLRHCSETEWEAVKLSRLSHCSAAALGLWCSRAPWRLPTHMSTTQPKDTSVLLTSWWQHNQPTTCYILSWLVTDKSSQTRTTSNAISSAKPLQRIPISTCDSLLLTHKIL